MTLLEEIYDFVRRHCEAETVTVEGLEFIRARFMHGGSEQELWILPVPITETSVQAAAQASLRRETAIKAVRMSDAGLQIITVAEDSWRSRRSFYEKRLLSHLGIFRSIFARNCEVRRITRDVANAFLTENHSYGAAVCRHSYGLFEKDILVAVATFSNARRWQKEGREVRSYEWVRYAALPDVRIPGGMGKLLKKFTEDIKPDDIMSYADLEWSSGEVYSRLGFVAEGRKDAVTFVVDTKNWMRTPVLIGPVRDQFLRPEAGLASAGQLFYKNFGSLKYRLKFYR